MKTPKKFLLIVLLLGIALLFGIMQINSFNAGQPNKPQPSPTPEVLENGWYRFTDAEAGYSFDYPPEALYIDSGKAPGAKYNELYIQFSLIHGHGYQGMVLYILPNPKKSSVQDFLLSEFKSQWTKQVRPENLTAAQLGQTLSIGGNAAIKTTIPAFVEVETAPFFVFIQNGDKIIETGPMYGLMDASEITPESVQLFDQVLNTFRFNP